MDDLIKEITAAHGDRLDSLYTCESNRDHGAVLAIFLLVVGDAWELHKWLFLPDGSINKNREDSGVLNDVGREEFRGLVYRCV